MSAWRHSMSSTRKTPEHRSPAQVAWRGCDGCRGCRGCQRLRRLPLRRLRRLRELVGRLRRLRLWRLLGVGILDGALNRSLHDQVLTTVLVLYAL